MSAFIRFDDWNDLGDWPASLSDPPMRGSHRNISRRGERKHEYLYQFCYWASSRIVKNMRHSKKHFFYVEIKTKKNIDWIFVRSQVHRSCLDALENQTGLVFDIIKADFGIAVLCYPRSSEGICNLAQAVRENIRTQKFVEEKSYDI